MKIGRKKNKTPSLATLKKVRSSFWINPFIQTLESVYPGPRPLHPSFMGIRCVVVV